MSAPAHTIGKTCAVRVAPAGQHAWQQAADELATMLREQRATGDCSSVLIEVVDEGARLHFTTLDGRHAVRDLSTPDELAPAVEALLLTAGAGAPREPVAPAAPPQTSRLPADDAGRAVDAAQADRSNDGAGVDPHFGLTGGVRVGTHGLITPVVDAFGSLSLARWELGVLGQWEAGYYEIGDEGQPQRRTSGLAVSITMGRRDPVGGSFALLSGLSVGVAAMDEETAEQNPAQGWAEGRLGTFIGAVVPRSSTAHFRARLSGEIAPSHIGRTPEDASGHALLPWWATTLALGLEIGGS